MHITIECWEKTPGLRKARQAGGTKVAEIHKVFRTSTRAQQVQKACLDAQ